MLFLLMLGMRGRVDWLIFMIFGRLIHFIFVFTFGPIFIRWSIVSILMKLLKGEVVFAGR